MTTKRPKRYPMDGPCLEIQRLMERPRLNRERLQAYFKDRSGMRAETKAVAYLP